MALVMGNKDDDPLRNLFGGSNVWAPLMKWNRAPPNDGGPEYGEYGDQQDVDAEAGQPIVVKRSHSRQPVCEVLLNIVYVGNGTDGYEYRPNHYVTESCLSSYNTYQNKVISWRCCPKLGFQAHPPELLAPACACMIDFEHSHACSAPRPAFPAPRYVKRSTSHAAR